jgi:hypothetical protein
MDTRRVSGTHQSFRPPVELGTETVPVDLVELAKVRATLTVRGTSGFWPVISTFALLGVLTVIALLAIATSAGWSVLDAY